MSEPGFEKVWQQHAARNPLKLTRCNRPKCRVRVADSQNDPVRANHWRNRAGSPSRAPPPSLAAPRRELTETTGRAMPKAVSSVLDTVLLL